MGREPLSSSKGLVMRGASESTLRLSVLVSDITDTPSLSCRQSSPSVHVSPAAEDNVSPSKSADKLTRVPFPNHCTSSGDWRGPMMLVTFDCFYGNAPFTGTKSNTNN